LKTKERNLLKKKNAKQKTTMQEDRDQERKEKAKEKNNIKVKSRGENVFRKFL
jgi:hypothetical protein